MAPEGVLELGRLEDGAGAEGVGWGGEGEDGEEEEWEEEGGVTCGEEDGKEGHCGVLVI